MKRKRSRGWVGLNAPRWVGHHVIGNGEGAMMKQFMRALLCLCLLLPLGAKAEEFSDVFVFGDSLSDTGNLAVFADAQASILTSDPAFLLDPAIRVALCFPGPFPFSMRDFPCADLFFESSRVSNGPVAVEVLAENLESAGLLDFGALKPSLHFLPLIGLGPFRPPPRSARTTLSLVLTPSPLTLRTYFPPYQHK